MAKQNDATHVKGIKSGNSTGNYERIDGPQARRHVDAGALDRRQREGPRADRPADAEPVACCDRAGFAVEGAARVEHAAVPTLRFALRIASAEPVRSVLLDVQVQIAARRRGYDAAAHDRLFELFGPVADWGTTLRTLLWTRTTLVVPAFDGLDGRGPRCAVLLRPRGRGVALPRRALRRRRAARVPVQRQRLLHRRRRGAADHAAVLEQRGGVRAAGARVEGDDGALLPRHGVGAAEQGVLRPAVGVQVAQRARELGRRAGEAGL